MKKFLLMIFSLSSLMVSTNVVAQKKKTVAPLATNSLSEDAIIKAQNFRLIGPFRGGRAASAVGSYTDVNTFYMGATGGGVWKTTDAGSNWKNISDDFLEVVWALLPLHLRMNQLCMWEKGRTA